MKKLFDQKPILFAVICIVLYTAGLGTLSVLTDNEVLNLLMSLGFCILLGGILLAFAGKHKLNAHLFLQGLQSSPKQLLYFLPLTAVMTCNLWGGFRINAAPLVSVLSIMVKGLGAGFLEELIFRGILFRAIAQKNTRNAFLWAALGFGIGHAVNLLRGADTLQTLEQLVYASCIGFAFMAVTLAVRSLLPSVCCHFLINSLSVFSNSAMNGTAWDLISTGILCAVCVGYGFYVLHRTGLKLRPEPYPD